MVSCKCLRFWFTKINFPYCDDWLIWSSYNVSLRLKHVGATSLPLALHTIPGSGHCSTPAVRDACLSTCQEEVGGGTFLWLIVK